MSSNGAYINPSMKLRW